MNTPLPESGRACARATFAGEADSSSSRRRARIRGLWPVMYAVLAIVLCNRPDTAAAADLHVTVQTPTGQLAGGAAVCAGVPQNPAQYASATTSSSGTVVLRNLPTGPVQIIAQSGGNGRVVVHQMGAGSQQSLVIRLPIAPTPQSCGASQGGGLISNPQLGPTLPDSPPTLRPSIGEARPPKVELKPSVAKPVSAKVEYCFGALGAQCGLPQANLPTTALCAAGHCQINAGSWEHDECCFANPGGMACTAGPLDYLTGHNGRCVKEWNKALSRLAAGLNWTRPIDFNEPNGSGRVNFSKYCAPTGTRLHADDVRYCCSRQADPVPPPPGVTQAFSLLRQCK